MKRNEMKRNQGIMGPLRALLDADDTASVLVGAYRAAAPIQALARLTWRVVPRAGGGQASPPSNAAAARPCAVLAALGLGGCSSSIPE